MSLRNFFKLCPEKVIWSGWALIGSFIALAILLFWQLLSPSPWGVQGKSGVLQEAKKSLPALSLDLQESLPPFPMPDLSSELSFSYDPPRPDGSSSSLQLLMRLKKSGQCKRVSLPDAVYLEYGQKEKLTFASGETPFSVHLQSAKGNQVEGQAHILAPEMGSVDGVPFSLPLQEGPFQSAQEFPERSPFRVLAEARWLGQDLVLQRYANGASLERLEWGPAQAPERLDLQVGQWIVWQEGKWEILPRLDESQQRPIARIKAIQGKSLLLEGWEIDHHVCLSLNPFPGPLLKTRGEELFSALRIRSEKQISCMLEKQCLILRTGDWVLKTAGRWKVLRKPEEREAFLQGKGTGELFVLDRIELKQGQKGVQGHLFNAARSQMISLEIPVQNGRKTASKEKGEKPTVKGKGK